ncbi:hypothetical protein BS78_02G290800 [Paspalum vaginatum]|nr:hypothetical protein BS78_02G290800 [Paspalum vaginatum]
MAAMARNTVLLLVLVGIVVQMCSVVPPTAAAGRALLAEADAGQLPCRPKGGLGGEQDEKGLLNGGGNLACAGNGKPVVDGAVWNQGEVQHAAVNGLGVPIIRGP